MMEITREKIACALLGLPLVACGGDNGAGVAGENAQPWVVEADAATTEDRRADTARSPHSRNDAGRREMDRRRDATSDGDSACGEACCGYWIDLTVRSEHRRASSFAGTLEVAEHSVDFRCPAPDGGDGFSCEFQPVGARGSADTGTAPDGDVRIELPDRPSSPLRKAEVEITSDVGHFEGTVSLESNGIDPAADPTVQQTCAGSLGVVRVESERSQPEFERSVIGRSCQPNGGERMVFRAGTSPRCRSREGDAARLSIEIDEEPPDLGDRHSHVYPYGPNEKLGRGVLCSDGRCRPVSGILAIRSYYRGEAASGYWSARTAEGELLEGRFSATDCSFRSCE